MSTKNCNFEKCQCQLRVLVVDNDGIQRNDHAKNLRRWGFEPIVVEGKGRALLKNAKQKIIEQRCHVALVDMRLLDDRDPSDHSGLELAPYLKPAKVILVTGYATLALQREAQKKGIFTVFGKQERPADLHEEVCNAASHFCNKLMIHPDNFIEKQVVPKLRLEADTEIIESEIRDLLVMMFPEAKEIFLGNLDDIIASPTSLSSIRRKSIVFRGTVDNQEPIVIKLATPDKIAQEVKNYNAFIEGQLGGHHYSQNIAYSQGWNLSGAAYRLFGETDNTQIFTQYYRSEPNSEEITKSLGHFFTTVWNKKYEDTRKHQGTLFKAFNDMWDGKLEQALEHWEYLDKNHSFSFLPGEFLEPRRWLVDRKASSAFPNQRMAVIHGDLHAENLFADNNEHTWVIDFERTNWGPIVGDFTELEMDILSRVLEISQDEFSRFYELILALTSPNKADEPLTITQNIQKNEDFYKAFKTIRSLREIAIKLTKQKDMRAYYWGVLLDALFVYSVLNDEQKEQRGERILLIASIIAHRLEKWQNKTWPLQEWPQVNWLDEGSESSASEDFFKITSKEIPNTDLEKTMTTFNHGYALLIGVNETPKAPDLSLPVTAKDVETLKNTLRDPDLCSYSTKHVGTLTGQGATLANIKAGFVWLSNLVDQDPNATAIIYFSGHGIQTTGQTYYGLIPADVESDEEGNINSSGPMLWSQEFQECINSIKAKRLLVLIDSCHAQGAAHKGEDTPNQKYVKSPPPKSLMNSLGKGEGRVVISSCREDQKSYIRQDQTLSIFTHHLVEALNGASNQAGEVEVKVSNLTNHLGKAVPTTVHSENPGYEQIPWTEQAAEDFSVALIRGGKGVTGRGAAVPNEKRPSVRDEYNVPEIRELLANALSAEELNNLCFDYFPEIYNEIPESNSTSVKQRKLIDYCVRRPSKFSILLEQIQALNFEQYAIYEERIFVS